MVTHDRRTEVNSMAQQPSDPWIIGAITAVGGAISGWFIAKSNVFASKVTAAQALDNSLLKRIEMLDSRVQELERKHDEDVVSIARLEAKAVNNEAEIKRLTAENEQLRAQLDCDIVGCPYVKKKPKEEPRNG